MLNPIPRIQKALPGKEKRNVLSLVAEYLARSKRSIQSCPAGIDSQFRHTIGSRNVEALVFHAADHRLQKVPTPIRRIAADNSRYARHFTLKNRCVGKEFWIETV